MDIKRLLLTVALAVVGLMLWTQWQQEHPSVDNQHSMNTVSTAPTQPGQTSSDHGFVPPPPSQQAANGHGAAHAPSSGSTQPSVKRHDSSQIVRVNTDVLHVAIDLRKGDIVGANLPRYPVSLQEKNTPISILGTEPGQYYVLQSGVSTTGGQSSQPLVFHSAQNDYKLSANQNDLVVTLTAQRGTTQITKRFHFFRGKYLVRLKTQVKNTSNKSWSGSFYSQIARQQPSHHLGSMAYTGGAISSQSAPYEKIKYKAMDKANLSLTVTGGWVAMQQHYFLSTWVPDASQTHHYYSFVRYDNRLGANVYYLGLNSNLVTLAPGKTAEKSSLFYVGPEKASILKGIAPGLGLTVDYGILSPISLLIFWLMQHIFHLIGNWGWTIVMITLLIKLALYWPSALSYRSMARMKVLAPRLKSLQERHANDKQALSKATMELYKSEKVNPMGGCLPMIVQIPIFIALYWVLIESVQLRQAPFIFWIHDLSVKDPFYVLPILMGASMFFQQKMSPAPADPSMAKMQLIMPVVFTVFFLHFPAGLVLYWLTNNLVSVAQQSYIMKTFDIKKADQELRKKKQRKR